MKLSRNFELKEFTESPTAKALGIENVPNNEHVENLKLLCEQILQPARDWFDEQIKINSGYRTIELNKAINGAKKSQHLEGKAADITCSDNKLLFEFMRGLDFDQLIWEFGNDEQPKWIHVSYNGAKNRKQVLKINANGAWPF